ncbi:MAG: CAP domain-containing protein [Chloroflexi bacterium]|nr:MAG: CAP domain-containing protein [Chloroflexota bacterium]
MGFFDTGPSASYRRVLVFALGLGLTAALAFSSVASAGQTSTGSTAAAATATTIYRPYYSVEVYYLRLLNCTRTGGWVTSGGSCLGYGSGRYSKYVAPLPLSSRISDYVSRPYARMLAVKNLCGHYSDGDPGYRLRRAGLAYSAYGENLGCRNVSPYASVLGSHLFFQSERSYNGWHWRNMKNPLFRLVGIGVWAYGGRTRLLVDFYRPA